MDPNASVVVLRPALLQRKRTRRRWFSALAVVGPAIILLLVGILGLKLAPTNRPRAEYRLSLTLGVLYCFWLLVVVVVYMTVLRRAGYYASNSEVGSLTVTGAKHPTTVPVARWVRRTIRIPVGVGRDSRFVFGIDADDRRVVGLPMAFLSDSDVAEFLAHTELPVEGTWSDRIQLHKLRRDFPLAPQVRPSARRWLLYAALGIVELVVLGVSLIVAVTVAG